jgi:hypothetical protein
MVQHHQKEEQMSASMMVIISGISNGLVFNEANERRHEFKCFTLRNTSELMLLYIYLT